MSSCRATNAKRLVAESGAISMERAIDGVTGDTWVMLARVVEGFGETKGCA